ncbi:glycosyltransferase family 4 protein [Paenibacillus cellulosilyticus]|nr:glycosyltransferase family 4 protein [Paenibacillus cellulosilyticus]
MVYLLFSRNKTIIVGAAPYDSFIYYLYLLKKNNEIIYYSSWPYWDYSKYPKKLRYWGQLLLWKKFLANVQVVGVTEKVTQGLSQFTPRSIVIPHCINSEVFTPAEVREKAPFRIIYVGRLIEEKGIDLILQIMNEWKGDNRFEWIFVGDGPYRDKIQALADQDANVTYYGQIKDPARLAQLYNQSHLLFLPSQTISIWEELFGIVLIEAMACGVVPLSSNAIGPKTIIDHDKDGYLVAPDDIQSMKNLIAELAADSNKFDEMSRRAQEKVSLRYTISITSQLWWQTLSKDPSPVSVAANAERVKIGG